MINAIVNTVYTGLIEAKLLVIAGWTGLTNCGNLLTYKLDVGNSTTTLYGYRDPSDPSLPFGDLDNNIIANTILYAAHVDTNTNICQLRFGVNGFSKIQDLDVVTFTFQGYPPLIYLWDGANLDYRVVDIGLTNYISALDGQRISFDPDYIAVQAFFDGATALVHPVLASAEENEYTISLWLLRNTGVTTRKIYDIGDSLTAGNETNRLRLDNSGQIDAIAANTPDGGTTWNQIARVDGTSVIVENQMHHIFMTIRNNTVAGVGTEIMQIWHDGVFIAQDITFIPDGAATFSFVAGDVVTIAARHNLTQFLEGRLSDVWATNKYMDPATYIPMFRKSTPGNVTWNGGVPIDLGVSGIVGGFTPVTWLGGKDYKISDWNAGINRGVSADFTVSGGPITG